MTSSFSKDYSLWGGVKMSTAGRVLVRGGGRSREWGWAAHPVCSLPSALPASSHLRVRGRWAFFTSHRRGQPSAPLQPGPPVVGWVWKAHGLVPLESGSHCMEKGPAAHKQADRAGRGSHVHRISPPKRTPPWAASREPWGPEPANPEKASWNVSLRLLNAQHW